MTIKLLLATDSLTPPLTGIGYYTAHLLDEFLRRPEIGEIRGVDHGGIHDRTELADRLKECTDGELGWQAAAPGPSTKQAEQAPPSHWSRHYPLLSRRAKDVIKMIPGTCTAARHWYAFRRHRALARAATKGEPWLLHAPNFIPPKHQGPTVITIHDLSHIRHPESHPADRIAWHHKYLAGAIARANRIITVSEFTRQELLALGMVSEPEKIAVCYNGVAPGFAPRSLEDIRPELENWGLEAGRYIISVATMEPRKNLEKLLDAYQALPTAIAAQFPLVLTGASGWKNRPLKQRIARVKPPRQVISTGYLPRPAMQRLLCGAGAFAYLSFYEGFGLPVVEAMACGTPVLTANTTSLAEIAGSAALTVDPMQTEAITDGLQQLLTNRELAEKLKIMGRERAGLFSWQRCADQTMAVYRQATEKR